MVAGDELRQAMRRHAAGICVVTAVVDGTRFGATVASFVPLALDPPLVGMSIGHQASFHEPLRDAGRFGVSILAGDQARLAQHFGRSGVPPLALWDAWLTCRTRAEHLAGDHTIVVADVETIELGRDDAALVHVRGAYEAA